ncbi:MAG TPA: HDOD domain-containing protein [Gammaproteobacteria bacterium]|nr:HDOD domain-containing protein [Gammaproteobacteria bacterium]
MSSAASATSRTQPLPARIGRFEPLRVLGTGGQGRVYLARDPELDRQVALKTLRRGHRDPARLIQEARHVARLDHPGIVPLYEIDLAGSTPYLVYQYAPGLPLARYIGGAERLPAHRALRIVQRVLEAVAYAHGQGLLHRDLSPSNILVDDQDGPRILDFGVSTLLAAGGSQTSSGSARATGEIVGTVNYLPPEVLDNGEIGPHSDVYAIGVILHELLSGRRLFEAENPMAVMFKIVHDPIPPPSAVDRQVDERLDALVMKAIARDPASRHRSAGEMAAAIEAYLAPEQTAPVARSGQSAAIDFLLRRIQRKPDFPAVSRLIVELNQKCGRPESDDVNELASLILKDYALTSKLLRLVNSAVYGQYGGSIGTVSRAVLILGFDAIRAAALSIAIFEHLKNGQQAEALKDAACASFLSGVLARDFARGRRGIDGEESFIAGMLHRLGRHLAIYYFPEEFDEIQRLVASRGLSEAAAAREALGTGYAEFGVAVARQWNFPERLLQAMTPPREGRLQAANTPAGTVAQLAAFANDVADAVGHAGGDAELDQKLLKLGERYRASVDLSPKELREAVGRAVEATRDYAGVLALDVESASFFKKVVKRLRPAAAGAAAPAAAGGEAGARAVDIADAASEEIATDARKTFLVNAIAELTNALLEGTPVNQIFTMVLESFYRGMDFTRVLLLIRDPKRGALQARFGFGAQVEDIMPKFGFRAGPEDDVFNEAARRGKDFVILDVEHGQYRDKIPAWCRELAAPRSILLFPLTANRSCIGLVYADKVGERLDLKVQELKLLNTLIKQALLAFQQRR